MSYECVNNHTFMRCLGMNRRTSREKALQILFSIDLNSKDPEEAIRDVLEEQEENPFLTVIVKGVMNHIDKIDAEISNCLENWTIDRIASVEKTILRMATYELLYLQDIPESVSMNEAVELAKIFSDEESGKFVNGVLSKIIKR